MYGSDCCICRNVPDSSTIYKCNMNHLICSPCFVHLANSGIPRCPQCFSFTFKQTNLYYDHDQPKADSIVTVESLFQMPKKDLMTLFSTSKSSLTGSSSKSSFTSRKPLICPHSQCRRVVTTSTFSNHCKYDHRNTPKFSISKGNELEINHDLRDLEYGNTIFLGEITVYNVSNINSCSTLKNVVNVTEKFSQNVPIGLFWLMASGSYEEGKNASVIYWMMTNADEPFGCTLEVSSIKDTFSYSTFCGVNSLHESHKREDVLRRLKCLFVTYGALNTMLAEAPEVKIRVIIH